MSRSTVRFYYEAESGQECLIECTAQPNGWEPTRVEPEPENWFTPQELDIISVRAAGIMHDITWHGYVKLGRYFSDEAELAIRELEDARESWGQIQSSLDRIKYAERQFEIRVRSIESEINEKFKKEYEQKKRKADF